MAEATIVSRYLPWVRGSRVAEATIVSRYHRGVCGDPRGRSHYRQATITPWSVATRAAETIIVSRHLQFEFEVETMMIAYYAMLYIYELRVTEAMIRYLSKWGS